MILLEKEDDWGKWKEIKEDIHVDIIKVVKLGNFGGPYSRQIWLEVKGLLPAAWTSLNFKRLVKDWGELLFMPVTSKGLTRIDKVLILVESKVLSKICEERTISEGNCQNKVLIIEIELNDDCKDEVFRVDQERRRNLRDEPKSEGHSKLEEDSVKFPVGVMDSGDEEMSLPPHPLNLKKDKKKVQIQNSNLVLLNQKK